jgi:hypothetical protein
VSVCVPSCYQVVTGSQGSGANTSGNTGTIIGSGTDGSINQSGDGSGSSGNQGGNSNSGNGGAPNTFGDDNATVVITYGDGGGKRRRSTDNSGFVNCDFNTLTCADGMQLTGCRIQGGHYDQLIGPNSGGTCNMTQGDGRNTGAAVPIPAASMSSSSAAASQTPSSSASSSGTTSSAAIQAAAASASPSTKSSGAADLRPHAVGSLLAIAALASMLF